MLTRGRVAALAGAVILALGLLAGCGGADDTAAGGSSADMTVTATSPADAERQIREQIEAEMRSTFGEPDDAATERAETGPKVTTTPKGGEGSDGTLTFSVVDIESYDQMTRPDGEIVKPPDGAQLVAATVSVRNDGVESSDPFCGGRGASLLDAKGRLYDMTDETIEVTGNTICRTSVQPGLAYQQVLLFAIPTGAKVAGIAFWDPDQADDQERSVDYVVVKT